MVLLILLGCSLVELEPPPAASQPSASDPTPRFGTTVLHSEHVDLTRTGASWYLNWTPEPSPGVSLEFVPMVCAFTGAHTMKPAALAELSTRAERYPDDTLFVIGNEIGHPPQNDRRTPEQYARDFAACRDALSAVNRTFRFSVGALILSDAPPGTDYVGATDGYDYLNRVLGAWQRDYGDLLPADFFAATSHVLEGDGTSVEVLGRQIVRFRRFLYDRGLSDRGVIITEYGVAIGDSDSEARESFLVDATHLLSTARDSTIGCPADGELLVQRFAWFNADSVGTFEKLSLLGLGAFFVNLSQTALFTRAGELTALGAAYARVAADSRTHQD